MYIVPQAPNSCGQVIKTEQQWLANFVEQICLKINYEPILGITLLQADDLFRCKFHHVVTSNGFTLCIEFFSINQLSTLTQYLVCRNLILRLLLPTSQAVALSSYRYSRTGFNCKFFQSSQTYCINSPPQRAICADIIIKFAMQLNRDNHNN